ncbi:translation initiation factor eIF-2B subunit alpha [Blastocladiella emersonii ATCC 22665]|nr:translation initiation factor eIF-2B subunit alpha [Blastocladiella emersonii ATCC 22665]
MAGKKSNSRAASPPRGGRGKSPTPAAAPAAAAAPAKPLDVLEHFGEVLRSSTDMTPPIAAIKTLVELVTQSSATTFNELHTVLSAAMTTLQSKHKHAIAASAGCTLFNQFAMKTFTKEHNFERTKQLLVARGNDFVLSVDSFRDKIAHIGNPFIQDDAVILIHSYSRVVMRLLQRAARDNKRFTVYVTESRPTESGARAVESLRKRGIPAHLILDSAVGYILEKVDLVLVGAEGVVETGGIINHIGTYQVAMVAKEKKVPVYAVAESYKFVRLFPLDQYDLGVEHDVGILAEAPVAADDDIDLLAPSALPSPKEVTEAQSAAARAQIVTEMAHTNPTLDYTPPRYITLLFTDKGVLAPSAVSDELIKVFL